MSYYYDDASYYHYSEPIYYDDTPDPIYYDNSPSETIYYNNTLPDHIYEDDFPSEPAAYDDNIHSDLSHFDDVTGTWSSPLPPMLHEAVDEHELEAYADATADRSYSEDEIHPAYRNQPTDSDHTYFSNTIIPSEDDIHPAYRNHPPNDNHEELPTPEHHWEEYTWVFRMSTNGVIVYDPPIDPTFYTPASHDNAPDWDLFQSIDLIATVIEDYGDIEERMPRIHQLTLVSRHMEEILAKRRAERDVEDEVMKVCEDEANVDTLIPLPPPPDIRSEPPGITPTFLITAPKRHEPRYYFPPLLRHRQPKSRNTTRTGPPPYIRLPKPHPISPNIHTRLHRRSLANQHPPDIRTPRPTPPKPNISIQSPPFQQFHHSPGIRPRRKHPPHSLIPRHYHNVLRRISNKGRLHRS